MKKNGAKRLLLLFGAFLVFGLLLMADPPSAGTGDLSRGLLLNEGAEEDRDPAGSEAKPAPEEEPAELLCVYVYGAVRSPGVYSLPVGSRVYDAAKAAGGYLPEADPSSLNPVRVLKDGEMLRVAFTGEESEESVSDPGDGLIDINTAGEALLMTLPGIGEAKAEAIVSFREDRGPFGSIEEIMLVSGIGEGIFSRIRDKIKV